MKPNLRKEIKENLKKSIYKYISKFQYKSTQPLDLLIPRERKIRSVVGGLETSMGTTVWEPIAKTLAKLNGFEVVEDKILQPNPYPIELSQELISLITKRENKNTWLPIEECIIKLRHISRKLDKTGITYIPPASGTGVDIYLKKHGVEYAFDIKTVQPNVGSIKSFNKQILEWYAFRLYKDPGINIECKIAYPYNPYKGKVNPNFWEHTPHSIGVLQPKIDAVVENEFWDFISGIENTYQIIEDILIELQHEDFGKEISFIIENIK